MASAEGGSLPSGVGYGEGIPSPPDQGGLWGSIVSSSSGVRGSDPAGNGFWSSILHMCKVIR